MSKSYLLWAVIGMIGYSVTAMLVKLATQSGRFSSYFVLMISSAMVVTTSTTITVLRGDIKHSAGTILPAPMAWRRSARAWPW